MTNDDFLYQRREVPRPEFAISLHQQLQQVKPVKSSLRRRTLQFVKTAAAISLLMVAVLAVSPEARAYVSKVVRDTIEYLQFGDVQVQVLDGDENIERGQSYELPEEIMSLAESQTLVPFKVPTWLPNDWQPVDTATVIDSAFTQDISEFERKTGYIITLYYPEIPPEGEWAGMYFYVYNNPQPQLVVGEGHRAQLIEINGHTGTLITGNWEGGTFGGESKLVVWTMDGLTYSVSSTMLPEEVLLKVARSVK